VANATWGGGDRLPEPHSHFMSGVAVARMQRMKILDSNAVKKSNVVGVRREGLEEWLLYFFWRHMLGPGFDIGGDCDLPKELRCISNQVRGVTDSPARWSGEPRSAPGPTSHVIPSRSTVPPGHPSSPGLQVSIWAWLRSHLPPLDFQVL